MDKLNLTKNELEAIYMTLNYVSLADQEDDNFSNAGMREFIKLMGGKHNAAGLVGSLEKKGIGSMDDEGDTFWLNDNMLPKIFNALADAGYDVEVAA